MISYDGTGPEPPFAARIRQQQSAEWRAAKARYDLAHADPERWPVAIGEDRGEYVYDPRQVMEELARPESRSSRWLTFNRVKPSGQLGTDLNAWADWIEDRQARDLAENLPVATFGPGPNNTMVPTNKLAEEIAQHQADRLALAKLRQEMENRHLPPGLEGM